MHNPGLSFATLSTTATPVSPSDLSGVHAVDLSGAAPGEHSKPAHDPMKGIPVNLHKMRCMCPELFAREFRHWPSVRLAMLLGEIDDKTARNYLSAKHNPQWPVVALYLKSLPPEQRYPALDRLIGEGEAA